MQLPVADRLEALRRLSPEELAWLLGRLPVVADALGGEGPLGAFELHHGRGRPQAGPSLKRLALLLATPSAIQSTLESLNRFEFQLAALAAWHGGALSREQALAEVGSDAGDALDAAAETLTRLLLAERTDQERPGARAPAAGRKTGRGSAGEGGAVGPAGGRGSAGWLTLRPAVAEVIGFPGVRVRDGLAYETAEALGGVLARLGAARPPRKHERLDALEARLRDMETIGAVVAQMPEDALRVFRLLAGHGPQRVRDVGIPYYHWYAREGTPLHWLTQRGLVGVDPDAQIAWVWLDVIVALNGRLFPDWPPAPPPATPSPLQDLGAGLPLVLGRLATLLDAWAADPAPALASGGLGVRPVRAAAKTLGLAAGEVGLLAHLAIGMGLLGTTKIGSKGEGRHRADVLGWAPTELASEWRAEPGARRWALLVQAWRDNLTLDESEGLPERSEASELLPSGALARTAFLRALAELPPERGLPLSDLAAIAAWHRPGLLADQAVRGLVDAARVLGLVPSTGPVGLTRLGRALLSGPEAVEAALPAPRAEFTVQADHTVIAPPDLAVDLGATLERYADVESAAGARIYRLSERRIAAALDDGERAASILGFLERHSTVPLAQNVAHLIRDCERRHGRLRAGTARAYLRCDDPALLTQAIGVKAAKLRLLAPTVAVSPLARDKLVAALRDRGLMPVAEAPDGATLARPVKVATPKHRAGHLPPLRATAVLPDAGALEALAKGMLADDDGRPAGHDPPFLFG